MCHILGIARSSYNKWLRREVAETELEKQKIAELTKAIHNDDSTKGYRRIKDDLLRDYNYVIKSILGITIPPFMLNYDSVAK